MLYSELDDGPLDLSLLPYPFDRIPDHITCLKECAEYQIRALLWKEENDSAALSTDDEDCLDDGFVLCDLAVPCAKIRAWNNMFPRVQPFFALKCNPDPMVAHVLAQLQAGFDCASVSELELARESLSKTAPFLRIVSSKDKDRRYFDVVYANPQRAEQDLDTALGMFDRAPPLTFDGTEELSKIHCAYQKQLDRWNKNLFSPNDTSGSTNTTSRPLPPDLILRLLVPDEDSSIPLGEKFGAAEVDIVALVERALELHLPIIGVSFHCGSGNHNPDSYATAIHLAAKAIEIINSKLAPSNQCWLLDIGGGFPGHDGLFGDCRRFCGSKDAFSTPTNDKDNDQTQTTLKIAQVITPLLDELFPANVDDDDNNNNNTNLEIISEPGRYFVEGAFALCSRIYRVRVDRDSMGGEKRHYSIAQGVQGVFKDCLLCSETFIPIPLSMNDIPPTNTNETVECIPSTIHGPSGEEYDVICRDYPLPVLEVGDWLIFDRLGAYTLSIAARNGRPQVRYVMSRMSAIAK